MFRFLLCNLVFTLLIFSGSICLSQDKQEDTKPEEPQQTETQLSPDDLERKIAQLILDLDSNDFTNRVAAQEGLVRIGTAARAQLLEAVQKSDSPEFKLRSKAILRELNKSIRHLKTISGPELDHVARISISPDEKFLYSAAYNASYYAIYSIDEKTGDLKLVEAVQDAEALKGVISMRISPDGQKAIGVGLGAKVASLFNRDEETGKLTKVDSFSTADSESLTFPIEGTFSPDGKYVYILDANCANPENPDEIGAVVVLKVNQEKLECVEFNHGVKGNFYDVRGIVFHPDKQIAYAAASASNCLIVLDYDPETGKLKQKQVLTDGKDGIYGLAGVMSVAASPD